MRSLVFLIFTFLWALSTLLLLLFWNYIREPASVLPELILSVLVSAFSPICVISLNYDLVLYRLVLVASSGLTFTTLAGLMNKKYIAIILATPKTLHTTETIMIVVCGIPSAGTSAAEGTGEGWGIVLEPFVVLVVLRLLLWLVLLVLLFVSFVLLILLVLLVSLVVFVSLVVLVVLN